MKRIITRRSFLFLFLFLSLFFLWGCGTAPPISHAPTITSSAVTTATVNVAYSYDVNATDPDGDTLTYIMDESPTGMTINPSTGLISWTPTPGQEGDIPVVVVVTDGEYEDSQSFVITFQSTITTAVLTSISVLPETMFLQVGNSQSITSITASYNTAADVTIPLNDPNCTYSSDKTSVATVANGLITAVASGSATITVSYTEGGITRTDTVEVTVPLVGIIVLPVQNITQNTGYLSIQDALDDAHDGDYIKVAKGTYHESIIFPSGKVIVLESIDGSASTIIEGVDGSATVTCGGALQGTSLEGFTITHQVGAKGSGIFIKLGTFTITECTISSNIAVSYGAGIFNDHGILTITNSTISNNFTEKLGGGIYNYDGALTITGSTVSENTASNYGGGIYNFFGALTITGSTVSENTAFIDGGGIYFCSEPTVTDIIGGSSSADTTKINSFVHNRSGSTVSPTQHIRSGGSGDIHGNYPFNYYSPG